nr:unnamed protein product [Spirometra erinaceieuropaei]
MAHHSCRVAVTSGEELLQIRREVLPSKPACEPAINTAELRETLGGQRHTRVCPCGRSALDRQLPSPTAPAPNPAPTTTAPTLITVAPNPSVPPPSITATSIISVTVTAAMTNIITSTTPATDRNGPNALSTTNTLTIIITTSRDVDSIPTGHHCGRKSISRIVLAGHL